MLNSRFFYFETDALNNKNNKRVILNLRSHLMHNRSECKYKVSVTAYRIERTDNFFFQSIHISSPPLDVRP